MNDPDPGRRTRRGDAGAGLIASMAGLLVFLAFLLFAVQILLGLYIRSVVTDAAHEGARRVAGARVDHADHASVAGARAAAEAEVRSLLGRFGDRAQLGWDASDADVVALTVRAAPPTFVWAALPGPWTGLVERTATARVERPR